MPQTTATFPIHEVPADEAVRIYRAVLAERPMTRVEFPYGGEAWVVHRHRAAKQLLESPAFVRAPFARGEREVPYTVHFPDFLKSTLQFKDPPEHSRLRRLVQKGFTAHRVKRMRGDTERIADELLDEMAEGGPPANLVEGLSLPLPIRVLSELLGVPREDRDRFIGWSKSMLSTSGMTEEEIADSGAQLYVYLSELIAQRRAEPREDLLSALAVAREKDDSLTDDEILTMAMLLLVAGFDNTANFVNIGVQSLLQHPDQRDVLLEDIDGVIPTAVEEFLRHGRFATGELVSAEAGLVPLIASEDVDIDGWTIREGEAAMVDPAGANHDPAVFEAPERLDVRREPNPHLTLNHGVHHCLGAPLARMELQVAIGSLFRRFPTLRLAGEPEYASEFLTAGLTALPVEW